MALTRQAVLDRALQWAGEGGPRQQFLWSPTFRTNYETDDVGIWALIADPGTAPPAPGDHPRVSCFSVFLLAMAHVAEVSPSHLHALVGNLYLTSIRRADELESRVWQVLLTGDNPVHAFDPRTGNVPEPRQLIFFNHTGHVMMTSRIRPGTGPVTGPRVEVLSLYGNYPGRPARTDVRTPIAVAPLSRIRDYYTLLGVYSRVNMRKSPIPDPVLIEYADPFWAEPR